jgi:molybdopterin-guanine dinucleotide biosynthesis protein A
VDTPAITAELLWSLADACADAAVPQTGPLPGAYRKSALPAFERRLTAGRLKLRDALSELDTAVVELDEEVLRNVNTPEELYATTRSRAAPVPMIDTSSSSARSTNST